MIREPKVYSRFLESVYRHGNRVFLTQNGYNATYNDVFKMVVDRPVSRPREVFSGPNSIEFVVRMLTAFRDRRTFVPLSNPGIHCPTDHPPPKGFQGDLSLILYTSGTTSQPKGVLLSEDNLYANLEMLDRHVSEDVISRWDHSVAFLPWSHCYGLVCELLFLMTRGARVVISQPRDAWRDIRKYSPSLLFTVPKVLQRFREVHQNRLWMIPPRFKKRLLFGKHLRFVSVGGARTVPSLLSFYHQEIGVPVLQGYGMTEASPMIALNRPETAHDHETCGYLLPGVDVRTSEKTGTLMVKGNNVFQGYLGSDNTLDRPSKRFEGEWFVTDDVMDIGSRGRLVFRTRLNDQRKMPNGKFIDLGNVEKTVEEIVCIRQAVAEIHPEDGLVVSVYLDPLLGIATTTRNLHSLVIHHLQSRGFQVYELPRRVQRLSEPYRDMTLKMEPRRHASK